MPAPAPPPVPHPLDDDVARLAALVPRGLYLPVVRGWSTGPQPSAPGTGWHACADLLADPEALPGWQDAVARQLERAHGRPAPTQVPPTYVMGWYLDAVARVGATWLGAATRVPGVGVGDLALHLSAGGWPDGAALLRTRFRCLPDDPAAGHPDAEVLPDRPALTEALRADLDRHARAFHNAFAPDVAIGSRQRFGMVDDVLEAAAWAAGELTGDPGAGRADAEALCGPNPTRVRRTCCFAYLLDPALLCLRCPRRG